MFVEILAAIESINGRYCFNSTILNLDNISSIRLRKSSASGSLNPNCFPAIVYRDCDSVYYELFQNDDIALNRYNEIITSLNKEGYYRRGMRVSQHIILMDESHENEPFRDYLSLFGTIPCEALDQRIQEYNQQILEGNKQEEETISEWLNNFVETRKKAREAEQTKEGKNLL